MAFTGALAEFGPALQNGVDLAAKELNEASNAVFGGSIMEIVREDSATNPSVGVDRARKLINTDGVVAIVGALSSGVTVSVAESVAIPSNVVMISPASTSPLVAMLPDDEDFIYRTVASDALQGVVGAQLARGQIIAGHSFDTASIFYVDNPYGRGLADAFEAAFVARGGRILAKVSHSDWPQPTYAAQLQQLLQGNPGVVLAASYPRQATAYMREARDLFGFKSWQFADATKSLEIIDAMGADVVQGLYGTAGGVDPNWPGAITFAANYAAFYGANPTLPYIDTTYDAAAVIGLALAKAHVDGVAINSENLRDRLRVVANPGGASVGVNDFVRAMQLIRDGREVNYTGAGGEVDFDSVGNVVTPVEIWRFNNRNIEPVMVRSVTQIPTH